MPFGQRLDVSFVGQILVLFGLIGAFTREHGAECRRGGKSAEQGRTIVSGSAGRRPRRRRISAAAADEWVQPLAACEAHVPLREPYRIIII